MTQKALAERVNGIRSNEMAVSSCLKILEKGGYIERGSDGEHQAKVTLRMEPEPLRRSVQGKGKTQKEIADYFLDVLGGGKDRTLLVDLDRMAEQLNLSTEQLRRHLSALQQTGIVEYRPPFRGRGLKILSRVPVSKLKINFQEIERRGQFERDKLRKMTDYAYSEQCLRRFILEYFGERVTRDRCGNCSGCLHQGEVPPPRTFGRKERIAKVTSSEQPDTASREDLFSSLREMRLKIAQASGLPPFIIFHDRTLRAICEALPQTPSEMLAVKGCGENKVSSYGTMTIEVVRDYLKRHPEAVPFAGKGIRGAMASVAKKTTGGSTVEMTWLLWGKGATLEEIARKRDLTPSTIAEHLRQLIDEGRPIDLTRIFSMDRITLIEEAIARAGVERLSSIKTLLPQDVSYDEIRLVTGQTIRKEKDKKRKM